MGMAVEVGMLARHEDFTSSLLFLCKYMIISRFRNDNINVVRSFITGG